MRSTTELRTVGDLLRIRDDGHRYELVQGEIRQMTPAGRRHGVLAMRLGWRLAEHVEAHGLGEVPAAETGFKIHSNPDTVRAPDVAFIRKERLTQLAEAEGYYVGPPDLAVEVVSPNDSHADVEERVLDWLASGSRLVLVLNPRKRVMTAYRSRSDIQMLTVEDVLAATDVVPGWTLRIGDLFD